MEASVILMYQRKLPRTLHILALCLLKKYTVLFLMSRFIRPTAILDRDRKVMTMTLFQREAGKG